MGAKRKPNMIDENPVDLMRLGERGKKQLTEDPHDWIVVRAAVAELQRASPSLANVVGDLFER